MPDFLEPIFLIKTFGMLGIFAIVFAESGLFFGFFFPGDSLLFTAGFLASQNFFNIGLLFFGVFVFAVLGDNVGYIFGKKIGPKIFTKEESFFFRKRRLEDAKKFFEKHGEKAIVLARFVPVVRTFTPIFAGVGGMNYRKFFARNVLGGFLWTAVFVGSGFFFGSFLPGADRFVLPVVLGIIFLSVLPPIFEYRRNRLDKKRAKQADGTETNA